jgi:alpha-galactosidase
MHQLKNDIFNVIVDPKLGSFDILTNDKKLPSLKGIRFGVTYNWHGSRFTTLVEGWDVCDQKQEKITLLNHGEVEILTLGIPADVRGIAAQLQIGVIQEYPLVIWKITLQNQGADPVEVERIEVLNIDPKQAGEVLYPQAKTQKDLGFFSNGWQSWSPTQWYSAVDKMNISKLGRLQHPMIYNEGTPLPRRRGSFSSDMFGVIGDRAARSGFVLGFLSQLNHFGSIWVEFNDRTTLRMWANGDNVRLDPGRSMETDWVVFNPVLLDHRDPLDKYLDAVARENHIRVPDESPVGWCSWYHFYTHLTVENVRENLKTILDHQEILPIQLVQIDDGFETQVGDWFSFKSDFPDGVAPLAEEIIREGLLPGLWLAPFIVHPKSTLIKVHPDWILRKKNGKPVNSGYGWGTLDTALDLTIPDALSYVCSVVKTASQEWGFPYLKLDFLYAAALPGVYQDPTQTRAQVLRKGMQAIREAVGLEVTLVGCGAPFGPMLGLVDAMRIGADVSGNWNPKVHGIGSFIKNEPSFPCARNSIRNILTRANLHKHWWINDPDCLLLRPQTHLSLAEVQSLASAISLTGGSLLLSDDLPNLPAERRRIAEILIPVIGERARVVDWFDAEMPEKLRLDLVNETGEWHILSRFNWTEAEANLKFEPAEYHLPEGNYWVHEFWTGKMNPMSFDKPTMIERIPTHGCAVFAVRRKVEYTPCYLGSDLHISQGLEVAHWKANKSEVDITLRLPRKASGMVTLYLPGLKHTIFVEDHEVAADQTGRGIVTFPVIVDGFANIACQWQAG